MEKVDTQGPEHKDCPITGHAMVAVFTETVLGKHKATYYFCEPCGLLQAGNPHWLDEAYGSAIAHADTGLVSRNWLNHRTLEPVLDRLFPRGGKFLDVGGGYGLLARLLRDIGFDCYSVDPHCKNLFAESFEPGPGFKADALFACEVLEHVEHPVDFLRDVFKRYGCRTVVISTAVFADGVPPKDWWYYQFEEGQHITFYQTRTLGALAAKLGCRHYVLRRGLHLITDLRLPAWDRFLLTNRYAFRLLRMLTRVRRRGMSKTWEDHLYLRDSLKKKGD